MEQGFITVPKLTMEQYWEMQDAYEYDYDGTDTIAFFKSIGIEIKDPECASMIAAIIQQDGYIHTHNPKDESLLFWKRWKEKYGERMTKVSRHWASFVPTRKSGYIYVLKANQYYKIGRTKDITKRFPQIHIHLPFETRLVCLFYDADCHHIENVLHEWYKNFRTNGEWFKLPYSEVVDLRTLQPNFADMFDLMIDEFGCL